MSELQPKRKPIEGEIVTHYACKYGNVSGVDVGENEAPPRLRIAVMIMECNAQPVEGKTIWGSKTRECPADCKLASL